MDESKGPLARPVLIVEIMALGLFLRRWYKLLLCFVVAGVIAGITARAIQPSLYVGTAVIEIGSVGVVGIEIPQQSEFEGGEVEFISGVRYYGFEPGRRLLATPSEMYRILSAKYNVVAGLKQELDPPYIYNMDNLQGDGIKIFVKAESKEQARKYLNNITADILDEHEELFLPTKNVLVKLKKLVEDKIDLLQSGLLENTNKEVGEKDTRGMIIFGLLNKLYEIDRALSPINTRLSRKVGDSQIQLGRRVSLLISGSMGGLIGFIGGMTLVLFYELFLISRRPSVVDRE